MVQSYSETLSWVPKSRHLGDSLLRASEYARGYGHAEIDLDHMLLALTDDPDASTVLEVCGVPSEPLVAELIDRLQGLPTVSRDGDPLIAPALSRILEYAVAAARQSRRRDVNGAIVLAAIVGEAKSSAAEILRRHGMTFEEAIKALQNNVVKSRLNDAAETTTEDILESARLRISKRNRNGSESRKSGQENAPVTEPTTANETQPQPLPDASPTIDRPSAPPAEIRRPDKIATSDPDDADEEPSHHAEPDIQNPTTEGRRLRPDKIERAPPAQPAQPYDNIGDQAARQPPQHSEPPPAPVSAPAPTAPPTPAPRHWPEPQQAQTRPRPPPPPLPTTPPGPPRMPPAAQSPNHFPRPDGGHAPPYLSPNGDQRSKPPGAAWPGMPEPRSAGARPPNDADMHQAPQKNRAATANFESGQLIENIPRRMQVARSETVEVRIARSSIPGIADGLRGQGMPQYHDVIVTKAMTVRLRAPDGGFFVETASPETQWIDNVFAIYSDDFASWRFVVTPQTSGVRRLQLIVSARTVGGDGLTADTALPDQIVTVRVRANYARVARNLLGWSLAAVIGGLLARFGEGLWAIAAPVFRSFIGPM